MRVKPRQWPAQQGLVAPDWRWAWRGLIFALPLWEGSNPPRDLVSREPLTVLASPTFADGHDGRSSVHSATDRDAYELPGLLTQPEAMTLVVRCLVNDSGADFAGTFVSVGDVVTLRSDQNQTPDELHLIWKDTGAFRTLGEGIGASIKDDGEFHTFAGVCDPGGARQEIYLDGVSLGTDSQTLALDYVGQGSNTRVGRHGNTGTLVDFEGQISGVYIFGSALTGFQIRALSHDFYGPLRPARRSIGAVPGARVFDRLIYVQNRFRPARPDRMRRIA